MELLLLASRGYNQVQENINIVADWLEAGCIVQIDAGSPIGLLGKKLR